MRTHEHRVDNRAGYKISLFQTWHEDKFVPGRRPLLIVPGYGMNSFIFSFHPRGASLEGFLAEAGFEVWRVDMRGQGRSICVGGTDDFGLEDLALVDLGVAIDTVLRLSQTGADRVDVLGASLGGTIMFLHAVMVPSHRMGSLVALGSPVRWVKIHPALKLAFSSPALVGQLRFRGTRALAGLLLPFVVRRTPWVLSIYMNSAIVDTGAFTEMVKTVEDPNRHVNRQIAHWICDRDFVARGVNLSTALSKVDRPFLCIVANKDGIVPRDTAIYPYYRVGSKVKSLLEVGGDEVAMAHADLFVSNEAHERVFGPVAKWLLEQNDAAPSRPPEP